MKQSMRLALVALVLASASPAFATNDVVYINGLPLFVSTINSGAVQAVAVYTPANVPLSVADKSGTYASAGTHQSLSVSNSIVTLTVPSGSQYAQICITSQNVNYWDDGTAPTASVGMTWPSGLCAPYAGPLSALQFIAQTGTATLSVSYYK